MTYFTSRLLAFALVLFVSAGVSFAQDSAAPDYDAWTQLATRAEAVVEVGRASDAALEDLRAEVARWREVFLVAQEGGSGRIETLQAQLDALGDAPEEGEEDAEIATRRTQLTDQLARLRAPITRAEEAYTRADGVISEIDGIIRERQTNALLSLGPSPLNPANWGSAWDDLVTSLQRLGAELQRNFGSDALRAEARVQLPVILFLVALGTMLLLRGQGWAQAWVLRIRSERRGRGVGRFLLSLGQILLPFAGIYCLIAAVLASGMIGLRGTILLEQVPFWALTLLGIHWLADQSFHDNDEIATITLAPVERLAARRLANLLAFSYVARDVLDALMQFDGYAPATEAVLEFPILVVSGMLLFRLGRVRNTAPIAGSAAAAEDDGPFRMRFARVMGRAAMVMGLAGPALAAIGYSRVGEGMVYPFIATLGVVGLVLVLQRVVDDLYELVTGRHGAEADSLIPVMVGFVLILAALPVLALIWGARVADLTELWARFLEGFQLGETRISPSDFLLVLVVFVAGYMLTRLLQGGLRTTVLPKTRLDQGGRNAVVSGVGYVGLIVSVIVAVTAGGLDLSSLAIVAGALSVGIGFGLQNIVSNFVSGIILLIERPISQGDWIEVGGTHGTVKDISVRSTRIETFDRYDVIIPNADLVSGRVSNYTKGNVLGRIILPVGVAYGNDTRKVEKILLDIARQHDLVLMNPAPYVYFRGFGADSLDFEIRAVLVDVNKSLSVKTEMNHQIYERLNAAGIEIPFAQRDIWIRNPEALEAMGGQQSSGASGPGAGRDAEAEDSDDGMEDQA
ncbi:MAG: DUF3772 domain-containing protein [Pelagimonas sp.]|jgi:small-conductance mechanosensitive channel|nr:DUF3772 domain-containing protein [Pelagimonas sp.]